MVIDMIFIVDDPLKFHQESFTTNNSHYSGWSKRFPLWLTVMVQNYGSVYFHPLINLPKELETESRLKYGVISKDKAIENLTKWQNYSIPGRT